MSTEEKRIYVVVAEAVQVPKAIGPGTFETKTIYQPCGRAAAQVAHAVSGSKLLWLQSEIFLSGKTRYTKYDVSVAISSVFNPITTIVLSARSSSELEHIACILELAKIGHMVFRDDNPDVYGVDTNGYPLKVDTAIATYPVESYKVKDLLGYLPLWKHGVTG